uniref:Uncharacterized protein n=1 Tax=Knipowitschia caucasica TaxID=637954 RepID=A0AAV2L0L3_KNICA
MLRRLTHFANIALSSHFYLLGKYQEVPELPPRICRATSPDPCARPGLEPVTPAVGLSVKLCLLQRSGTETDFGLANTTYSNNWGLCGTLKSCKHVRPPAGPRRNCNSDRAQRSDQ